MNRFDQAPRKNPEKPRTTRFEEEFDSPDPNTADSLDQARDTEPLASEVIDSRWLGVASHPPGETETVPQYQDRLLKLVMRTLEDVARGSNPGQISQDAENAWTTLAYLGDLRDVHSVIDADPNAKLVDAIAQAYLGIAAKPNLPEGAKQMLRKGWEQFRNTYPTKSQEQVN